MKLKIFSEPYSFGIYSVSAHGADVDPVPEEPRCEHCNKPFPTHALYQLESDDGHMVEVAYPCLAEVAGSPEAAEHIHQEALSLRASQSNTVPLSDVLAHETERVRDYWLGLADNPLLTEQEKSFVLLARFPDIRTEHAHYLFDMHTHWLLNKSPEPAEANKGQHLGKVGERLQLDVQVTRIHGPFPGEFGDSYLCVMETRDDHKDRVIWWTGENLGFQEDTPYTIRGTVKKHDEYEGRKQTQLTRVKEVILER